MPDEIKLLDVTKAKNPDEMFGMMAINQGLVAQAQLKGLKDLVGEASIGVQKAITGGFTKLSEAEWDLALNSYVEKGYITQADKESMKQFFKMPFPIDMVMTLLIMFNLFSTIFSAKMAPIQEKIMQDGLAASRPTLPPGPSLIQAAFIAPEKTAEVRAQLARMGYSDKAMDLMFLANYRLYDETTVMILWLRKVLTDEQMFVRMHELGYTDTRIKEISQSWSLIPGPQDLLTMVAHEAFEPDAIAKMGLAEEFPDEQSEWLTKQGLNPYWQMKYWISHWEQPSIQMGYEMLQRGIITREDLEFLFRTVEIPRYWREKLLAIAYTPYTRVDARRMHKLGVLSDEELVVAYKDIGYDQKHAEKMAEFTRKANLAAEKDLNKTEVLAGYSAKLISAAQCAEFLIRLGYDNDEASYILAMQDYKEQKATAKLLQDSVGTRYQAALIDRAEARRLLDELNLAASQRDALLAKWDAGMIAENKVPSKTDLEDFYKAGIINPDVYRQEMARLGYSSRYTDWFEKWAKAQIKPAATAKK